MNKTETEQGFDALNKLAETMNTYELNEISVEFGDFKASLKKKPPMPPMPPMAPIMPQAAPVNVQMTATQSNTDAPKVQAVSGNTVKAPVVGTFYASSSPDKPPYVKAGDTVTKGQVICIVESMKIMNEINSEFSGTVKKILVNDGDALEFDQPIMIIG